MEWSQMITAFPQHRSKKSQYQKTTLMTQWGKELYQQVSKEKKAKETKHKEKQDKESQPGILWEYPRPQMVRLKPAGQYEILNGWWKYAIIDSRRVPQEWEGEILVPFSPETTLSFVERQVQPSEYLWYIGKYTYRKCRRIRGRCCILVR